MYHFKILRFDVSLLSHFNPHYFRSYMWQSVVIKKPTTNMKVKLGGDQADVQKNFSRMLCDVGEGNFGLRPKQFSNLT